MQRYRRVASVRGLQQCGFELDARARLAFTPRWTQQFQPSALCTMVGMGCSSVLQQVLCEVAANPVEQVPWRLLATLSLEHPENAPCTPRKDTTGCTRKCTVLSIINIMLQDYTYHSKALLLQPLKIHYVRSKPTPCAPRSYHLRAPTHTHDEPWLLTGSSVSIRSARI